MRDLYPISDTPQAEKLVTDMQSIILGRLNAAVEEKVLSDRGKKKVSVMREPDGSTYVSRKYDEASELVGPNIFDNEASLTERWSKFVMTYADAPFSILPSSVVRDDEGGAEIISAHREMVVPLREATLDTKKQIVAYLTSCAVGSSRMKPALATIQADMFNVLTLENGQEQVELLDVDPYLPMNSRYYASEHSAELLDAVIDCMAGTDLEPGWSASDEERKELARTMVSTVIQHFPGDKLDELFSIDNPLSIPFSTVHLMTNGVDPRRHDRNAYLL